MQELHQGQLRTGQVIKRSLALLPSSDKYKFAAVMVLQFLLAILDLLGVAIIGLIGALSISGINSDAPGDRTLRVLQNLHLNDLSFQAQVVVLSLGATFFLLARTLFSIVLSRKIISFLSFRGASISSTLVSKLLTQPLLGIRKNNSQETLFALTSGIQNLTMGVLATAVNLVSDFSLLLLLAVGLFYVDWLTAVAALIFFIIVTMLVYYLSSTKSHNLGKLNTELGIVSAETILEVLNVYRELAVRNRRDFYARRIALERKKLAVVLAKIQFLPNISKYVMESSLVVGALFLSGVQFLLSDAKHAFATLTVFLAAGTRIAPAVMRVQQGLITLKGAVGAASPSLNLVASLSDAELSKSTSDELRTEHNGFIPTITITSASYQYPGNEFETLTKVNLSVRAGEAVAIVGPSGAGKTTLVDLLLGLLEIKEGEVRISGESPMTAIEKWPGAIAYVPQDVVITNATIKENLGIGFPIASISDDSCWEALRTAQLEDFVKSLPNGLLTQISEAGENLSGGQRQRLGIARALLTKPKVIILDEATSSLDAQIEEDISNGILDLRGSVTTITIAHRLSTVVNADTVVYVHAGRILAKGTFAEVRMQVSNFDKQAQLMGL
jgi:ABC-type multidrug transport system fused ATPase/permease subunit